MTSSRKKLLNPSFSFFKCTCFISGINVEFDVEDNGNEKVITITTTSTLTEMVEEEPTEEVEEGDCKNKR
jgi:hypothetical protein